MTDTGEDADLTEDPDLEAEADTDEDVDLAEDPDLAEADTDEDSDLEAEDRNDDDRAENLAAEPASLNDRLLLALRQSALIGISLLVAGFVTERLRPDEVLDRGIASTPFLWAIVGWIAVLVLNALAFERSQIGVLETKPLLGAVAVGAVVFIVGLVNPQGSNFGGRVLYLFANSIGAVMFWWALFSIAALAMARIGNTR